MSHPSTPTSPSSTAPGESLHQIRLAKVQALRQLGVDPYAIRTPDRTPCKELAERFAKEVHVAETKYHHAKKEYDERRKKGEKPETLGPAPEPTHRPVVGAAGRVRQLRDKGKLFFIDLVDQTGKVQLFISKNAVSDLAWKIVEATDLGDFLWATGPLGTTMTGELSIFATDVKMLTKSTLPPPNIEEKSHGSVVADAEVKQRRRYLDLMMNDKTRDRFIARSKMVAGIRRYLEAEGFIEVETPMMQPLFGGAKARPFITHHNTLEMQLYLRIAPELYLKRLLVGGMERVFEINRNFRNEGIDTKHNPEFTMMELYEAFADYRRMMDLTEGCYEAALKAIGAGDTVVYQGMTLNFKRPWPRLKYLDLFNQHVAVTYTDRAALEKKAKELKLDPKVLKLPDVWLANELWEACVEPHLVQPCHVVDYPTAISPLAKQQPDNPQWVERFESFACGGMELGNAFSELNDPEEQRKRFIEQVEEAKRNNDLEVPKEVDLDYVDALSYGMPPAGGLGIGIDRLVMVLTDSASIRDIILFPLMRPR